MSGLKLDFGCGTGVKQGYEGVDCADTGPHVRHVVDLTKTLPWRDGSVYAIHANHILEHMPYWRIRDIIFEWSRVLAPDGIIEVSGPDILKIMHWVRGDPLRLLEVQVDIVGTHEDKYENDIGVVDPGRHRTVLCGPMVAWWLRAAGVYAKVVDFEKTFRTFKVKGNKIRRVAKKNFQAFVRYQREWPDMKLYEDTLRR